ncbi:hypothetical protein E2562_038712 [Oryza meyeriana var. granulata]|uniref:DUF834 domain-containing protein n=1 Tax=Oryza meyeriana var. granulata TaxID=110450 RepID=A0A6G1DSE5_9ORYZ|nr:hypothetical protein E2562_038712 [Oryza meyeriana var. granulata]
MNGGENRDGFGGCSPVTGDDPVDDDDDGSLEQGTRGGSVRHRSGGRLAQSKWQAEHRAGSGLEAEQHGSGVGRRGKRSGRGRRVQGMWRLDGWCWMAATGCCEDHVPVALGQAKQASAKAASDGGVAWWMLTTGGGRPVTKDKQRRCSTATAAMASDGGRRRRPVTCSDDNPRRRTKEGIEAMLFWGRKAEMGLTPCGCSG